MIDYAQQFIKLCYFWQSLLSSSRSAEAFVQPKNRTALLFNISTIAFYSFEVKDLSIQGAVASSNDILLKTFLEIYLKERETRWSVIFKFIW
jgi:hypothetical protein